MAYCTNQEILDLLAGLRESGNTDSSNTALSRLANDKADEITDTLKGLGYCEQDATEEEIIAGLNSSQALILACINALMAVEDQIQRRGSEVDPSYTGIAKMHKGFLYLPFNLLANNELFSAWNTEDDSYPIPTHRPSSRAITFSGTGTNNLTSSGNYTGTTDTTFVVQLLSSTTFRWQKDSGSWTGPVTITGSAQTLSDGVTVTIPTTGTHNASDQWSIAITVWFNITTVAGMQAGWNATKSTSNPTPTTANKLCNWLTCIIYAVAAKYGFPTTDLNKQQARKYGDIGNHYVSGLILQTDNLKQSKLNEPTRARMSDALSLMRILRGGGFQNLYVTQ